MQFLEHQHAPDLRGMLDNLVEEWKHGDLDSSEIAGRTLSNLIHIGGKVWENKLNAVHLVTNSQQSFQVAM